MNDGNYINIESVYKWMLYSIFLKFNKFSEMSKAKWQKYDWNHLCFVGIHVLRFKLLSEVLPVWSRKIHIFTRFVLRDHCIVYDRKRERKSCTIQKVIDNLTKKSVNLFIYLSIIIFMSISWSIFWEYLL